MKSLNLMFIALALLFLQLPALAGDSLDQYIQCRRDAEVRAILPQFNQKDPCSGSVLIQGISYECGVPVGINGKVQDFLKKLTAKAKGKCEEFCNDRAHGCHGKLTPPDQCGFTIPEDGALEYGRTLGKCSPKCDGQAFIYCSIYHAETLRYHEEFFQGKTPNCHCER